MMLRRFIRNLLIKFVIIFVLTYCILVFTYKETDHRTRRTKDLNSLLACETKDLPMKIMKYGEFWLARNLFVGNKSRTMGCAESITYTTHGDYTYFSNVEILVLRWFGPISFANFAPGYDLNATLNAIQYVRNCLPNSQVIRDYVTFHVFFPIIHMASYLPQTEMDALAWAFDCSVGAPYLNVSRSQMYKTVKNLTYPINTARNIARKAVNTHFILACDIELYPTVGLIEQFLDMIDREPNKMLHAKNKRVFTLPIFELTANISHIPYNKKELFEMSRNKEVVPFHNDICIDCHRFPRYNYWMRRRSVIDRLFVHCIAKRRGVYQFWEPIFISDNREPFYDERLTWEGQSDKRLQGFAMCLLDYEYLVLHPAFLVHRPGIKSSSIDAKNLGYINETTYLLQHKIEPQYKLLYGNNDNCLT